MTPSPLRALCIASPDEARSLIRNVLRKFNGHRGVAARALAGTEPLPIQGAQGRGGWLGEGNAYGALWRCIAALGMGAEVRRRWPRGGPGVEPKASRGGGGARRD